MLFGELFPLHGLKWIHPQQFLDTGVTQINRAITWVTMFIVQTHWVVVIRMDPIEHLYQFLPPWELDVSDVIFQFFSSH